MSEVSRYEIKPVIFEAIQWTGENERAVHSFLMPNNAVNELVSSCDLMDNTCYPLMIKTIGEGVWEQCSEGDYITKSKTGIGIMSENELKAYYNKIDDQEA